MPDQAIKQAADELHAAVKALQEFITREYPSRIEADRKYVNKKQSQQRVVLVIVVVLVSALFSFCFSVGTVSTCFLTNSPPGMCKHIPGYQQTTERNEEILKEFTDLKKRSIKNEKRIDRLEEQQGQ